MECSSLPFHQLVFLDGAREGSGRDVANIAGAILHPNLADRLDGINYEWSFVSHR